MTHSFALTFGQPTMAEQAFRVARSCASERLLQLDDAWIALRPASERGPIVQRPALWTPPPGLRVAFVARLFARLRAPADGPTLSAVAIERFAASMTVGSSALLVRVRKLDPPRLRPRLNELLAACEGRIVRLDETAPDGDGLPAAAELAADAWREIEARAAAQREKSGRAGTLAQARLAQFRGTGRAAEAFRTMAQRCREAARRGQTSTLAYRFPSAILTDRGRAVHAGDPTWPRTLTGEPQAVYALVERRLLPKGYAVEAAIVDYPDGLLGDVGLFLSWARIDA